MKNVWLTKIHGLLILILAISLSNCGISSSIRTAVETFDIRAADAIHSLDNAIAALAEESADWRVVVTNLEEEISEDVQSTIRTEVQDLTRNAILLAGAEFRCNAEFMRIRLRRELTHLRNSITHRLNALLANTSFSIPLIPEESPEPFICSVVPSAVDLSIDIERRSKIDIYGFDLKSRPISVGLRGYGTYNSLRDITERGVISTREFSTMLRSRPRVLTGPRVNIIRTDAFEILEASSVTVRDISNALSIISDFHAVLDLTESGADISPITREIVFSWDNKVKSEIAVLTHEKILECTTSEKVINPGTDTFTPPAVTNSPYDGRPDKDFAGHGPCVTFRLNLNLDSARRTLTATYTMDAWECPDDFSRIKSDYTQAIGTRTITLYTAAEDEKILSFNVQSSFNDQYIDTNHQQDIRYFSGLSPVDKLEYTGDTSGNEAGTRTCVKVTFRSIKLQIEKCQYQ